MNWAVRAVFLAGLLVAESAAAQRVCRQSLALGLDVSGSVDAAEYRLQLDGLAGALDAPEVRAALLASPEYPIVLSVYEWSGLGHQRLLVPWTGLVGAEQLNEAIALLRGTRRVAAEKTTAIGQALRHGVAMLRSGPDCADLTLDISGDGKNNIGPRPQDVRLAGDLQGVTVNALVIGTDAGEALNLEFGELSAYFNAQVISGPDAFVQVALGFADYKDAMQRKLLREIKGMSISQLTQP